MKRLTQQVLFAFTAALLQASLAALHAADAPAAAHPPSVIVKMTMQRSNP
jgi:hypothetical protein